MAIGFIEPVDDQLCPTLPTPQNQDEVDNCAGWASEFFSYDSGTTGQCCLDCVKCSGSRGSTVKTESQLCLCATCSAIRHRTCASSSFKKPVEDLMVAHRCVACDSTLMCKSGIERLSVQSRGAIQEYELGTCADLLHKLIDNAQARIAEASRTGVGTFGQRHVRPSSPGFGERLYAGQWMLETDATANLKMFTEDGNSAKHSRWRVVVRKTDERKQAQQIAKLMDAVQEWIPQQCARQARASSTTAAMQTAATTPTEAPVATVLARAHVAHDRGKNETRPGPERRTAQARQPTVGAGRGADKRTHPGGLRADTKIAQVLFLKI